MFDFDHRLMDDNVLDIFLVASVDCPAFVNEDVAVPRIIISFFLIFPFLCHRVEIYTKYRCKNNQKDDGRRCLPILISFVPFVVACAVIVAGFFVCARLHRQRLNKSLFCQRRSKVARMRESNQS